MRAPHSIVVRTAVYAAVLCGIVCVVVFVTLFEMQQRTYERRLVNEAEESISKIARTLVGVFFSQGNFVYLEDQQHLLNKTPNILYNYIVNRQGVVDLGIDGYRSADIGKAGESWEPAMAFSLTKSPVRNQFLASEELAARYPTRLKRGDRVVLVGAPITCSSNGEVCGQLRVAIAFETIGETMKSLRLSLTFSGILVTLGILFIVYWTTRRNLVPIRVISERMRDLAAGSLDSARIRDLSANKNDELEETRFFRESLEQFTSAFQRAQTLENELRLSRSLSDLAAQVAHDIRSPLAALEIVSTSIEQVPEERRIMLRSALARIRDIANNLLSGNQSQLRGPRVQLPFGTYFLASLVDELISEKRAQFRTNRNIFIEGKFGDAAYGLFVQVDPVEFKRVLSNIINNAVEAIPNRGNVLVTVFSQGESAQVTVADTGRGISAAILPQLTQKGFSHQKKGGVGLGLFHARKSMDAWKGDIGIESIEGQGTKVTLALPRVAPPGWFIAELRIDQHATVVVLDDDTSIHEVWQERLNPTRGAGMEVVHFSMPQELAQWHATQARTKRTLYLLDYEFIGSTKNGLQLVEELNLEESTVLVTSRFEEPYVLQECLRLGVKMIPKGQAAFVPILFERRLQKVPAAIIIDDDALVRGAWEVRGREGNKEILTYATISEFEQEISDIPKATPIFVDSVLGDEQKGEDYTYRLDQLGFENVFLATGYPSSFFPAMPWLKGIVGKTPPEWLVPEKVTPG